MDSGLTATMVYSLAVSGSYLFAGTNAGITDPGITGQAGPRLAGVWRSLPSIRLPFPAVTFLPERMPGIYRSGDNGASWTTVGGSLAVTSVYSFAVSGGYLFAGTENSGVYRSGDNGASWTTVGGSLAVTSVYSLAVSGGYLFAGTENSGVYRSGIME